jgi:hypothetical protein
MATSTSPGSRPMHRSYGHSAAMVGAMHSGADPAPVDNTPSQHAFIMMGRETLFIAHLTMYGMEEHNFQLVLQARLPSEAMRQYNGDRQSHPNNTYFLGNSPQDLLTVPDMQSGVRPYFIADVFRGIPQLPKYESWPWADQTPIIRGVPLVIERVVYFRHLAMTFEAPTTLTYALFGSGNEAHMTNYQTKIPDFDHVVSLAEPPAWLTSTQLQSGVHVSINVHRTADKIPCADPLLASNETTPALCMVKYRGTGPDRPIKIGYHHWFCTKIANDPEPDPCGGQSAPCGTPP